MNRDDRNASTDERRYHSRMPDAISPAADDSLVVAGRRYRSRLLTGTGKFKDFDETRRATEAAGAEIVTVAIRRTNLGQSPNEPNLLDILPPDRYTLLPNTAGCYTADDAVRTCRLARELLDGHKLVKLEVLGDERTLYPDVVQTLVAAERLVKDGFDVMVYTSDDPILARRLEEIGCVAVMPLAADDARNVRLYHHDAVEVLQHEIADGSLDEVRIYFPDPWHKKRHNKRRLVNPAFAALLVSKLAPGGRLHLATDWQDYAEQMWDVLDATQGLANRAGPRGTVPRPDWRPQTHFETRGQKLGHGTWDLLYDRTPDDGSQGETRR